MITKAGVEQENPFMPIKYAGLSPELDVWHDIKRAYARFPTQESLDRVSALNIIYKDLEKEGLVADLLIGGSLGVGQSIEESDIDIFGVVTPEETVRARHVIELYEQRMLRELGKRILFPVTADVCLFTLNNLDNDLESETLKYALKSSLPGAMGFNLSRFHATYQTCLGIGSNRLAVVEKIEALKTDPRMVRVLDSILTFYGSSGPFTRSFLRYEERAVSHPKFISLTEQERLQFVENLEERQRQFLFYITYPSYCRFK